MKSLSAAHLDYEEFKGENDTDKKVDMLKAALKKSKVIEEAIGAELADRVIN